MNSPKLSLIKYLCIVLAIWLLPLGHALAADITVDADCSLANAIRAANEEELVEPQIDCEAGDAADGEAQVDETTGETLPAGQDTISIDVSGTDEGVILLDATLSVTSEIVINGNGNSLDGRGNQIFTVSAGSLTLNDLTLTGGFSITNGGAIAVANAALTLNNSVVSGSGARGQGGGIYALDSDVTLVDSVVSGNVTNAIAADFEPVVEEEDDTDQTDNAAQAADAPIDATDLTDLEAQTAEDETEFEAQTEATPEATEEPEEVELPDVDGVSGGGLYFISEASKLVIERSGFDSNTSPDSGGGLYISGGSATINNSTISGNSAGVDGGGLYSSSASIVTHATITGNSAFNGGGLVDAFLLQLYNSILSDNAGGDCSGSLNANLGNIITDGSCNHDGLTADPELLLLAGSPAYYLPQLGSPAIDAALAQYCLPLDQRGIDRTPEACDIGASEHQAGAFSFQIQSALAALSPGAGGGGSGDGGSQDDETEALPTPPPSNCPGLPAHITVTGWDNGSNVNCTHLDYAGLGNQILVDSGALQAVDIFGWVANPLTVCFQHDTGAIVLLDAATSPRNIVPLKTWTDGNEKCAYVDRAGSAVLMPLAFFTSGVVADPIWTISDCSVTTTEILNLREHPNTTSGVVANVLQNVTLTADQHSTRFYRVNYYGIVGWLSKDYLTVSGSCR